jgi:polyhydroxybutyrate depolymerase
MPQGCIAAILGLFLATAAPARADEASGAPVALPDGTYRAVAPAPSGQGKPLPLVLYLHGHGESSADVLANAPLVEAVTGLGALMVVPDGIEGSWSHRGSPEQARDDLAFLRAVLADAARRWPTDPHRIVATGFSQGASMVWDLACHAADAFSAFVPVSGAFWLPYPESCETGPVNLRHIHGLSDTTVPMLGRTIRSKFRQGEVLVGFDILRRTDACPVEPDRNETTGPLECRFWSGCGSGRSLALCLHPGGHDIDPGQLRDGLAWALAFTR